MVEVFTAKGVKERTRGLGREGKAPVMVVGVGSEGVVAGTEHQLGEVRVVGVGGNTEVAEHGIGLPAAEQLDDVGVDVGAQKGCGATRAEAAGTEQARVDAGGGGERRGGVAEGVGDELGTGGVLATSAVPVVVEAGGRVGGVRSDVVAEAR